MTVSHILNSQPVSPKCQVIGKMLSRGLNHFLIDVYSNEEIELKVNELPEIPPFVGPQGVRIFGLIEYGNINIPEKSSSHVGSTSISLPSQAEISFHNKSVPAISVKIIQFIPPSLLFKLIDLIKSVQKMKHSFTNPSLNCTN